jgi:hypothetical protein
MATMEHNHDMVFLVNIAMEYQEQDPLVCSFSNEVV